MKRSIFTPEFDSFCPCQIYKCHCESNNKNIELLRFSHSTFSMKKCKNFLLYISQHIVFFRVYNILVIIIIKFLTLISLIGINIRINKQINIY